MKSNGEEYSELEKQKFFDYFRFFRSYLGKRIPIGLLLNFVVVLFDGIGIALIFSLLEVGDNGGRNNRIIQFLSKIFESVNVELTFTSLTIFIVILFSVKAIFKWLEEQYSVNTNQKFIADLRFATVDRLCDVSYEYVVKADAGEVQSNLLGAVVKTSTAFASFFQTMKASVFVLVYTSLAFMSNWKFALFMILCGGLIALVFRRLNRYVKEKSVQITLNTHWYSTIIMELLTSYKYLKSTALIVLFKKRTVTNIKDLKEHSIALSSVQAVLNSVKEPIVVFFVLFIIVIQVSVLGESIQTLVVGLLFFYRSLNFVLTLQSSWNSFYGVTGYLHSVQHFIQELEQKEEHNGEVILGEPIQHLKVENGCFYFEEGDYILSDINITIRKNSSIALVGESGSGKTTFVNLLAGLLSFKEGDYLVNGINFNSLHKDSFRSKIGYISQEPVVYDDTIFNNVTLWSDKNEETLKQFWEALELASVADFVRNLIAQEETRVGTNGVMLSGGQKQRISIARELYKSAELLILDEATSSLDSETERIIQRNIDRLKGDVTIIIIAHRLSTIANVDTIHFIEKGKIINSDNFEKLYENNATFKRMVDIQKI